MILRKFVMNSESNIGKRFMNKKSQRLPVGTFLCYVSIIRQIILIRKISGQNQRSIYHSSPSST